MGGRSFWNRNGSLAHKFVPCWMLFSPYADIEATKLLKKSNSTSSIPVIGLSAAAMKKDIERASSAEFFAYITQLLDIPHTLATIQAALKS